METYTISGTYTFMVDADSLDDAINQLEADMQEFMFDWQIDKTYGGK